MKIVSSFSLTALIAASVVSGARADITTGLVAWWTLADGPGHSTVIDHSGNGNTGTLMNFSDATYNNMWTTSTDPNNGYSYALLFNQTGEGTDTYVTVPDSTSLDQPSVNKTWTISAWVKCSVAGGSEPANAGILTKGVNSTGSANTFAYDLYMTGGKFAAKFQNAGNSGGTSGTSVTVPAANTWYHVVAAVHVPTVNTPPSISNSEVYVYVNGVQEYGTNSNTYTTMFTNSQPVTIGCFGAGANPFEGTIDDVRIYNRELSASDVYQLYTNKAVTTANSGIGYWNGLAGSGGVATLDTTSLNFDTNANTAPLGTAANLPTVLSTEAANALTLEAVFADNYFNSSNLVSVTSTNINIASGGVAVGGASGPGRLLFLNDAAVTYSLNSIDSTGLKDGANASSIVESGTGTVVLTGINTFSGGTTINAGVLQVGNGGSSGAPLGSGAVTDNSALLFDGNDNPVVNNNISGTGVVVQGGTGILTLGNTASTYTGGTTISNGGTLLTSSLSDSSSPVGLGPVNLAGGTLDYTATGDGGTGVTTARQFNGTAGSVNTIDVASGATLSISGRVTSSAAWVVNKTDSGTLDLAGTTDNSFLGMNVMAGKVILDKSGGTGHAIGNPLTVSSGAEAQFGNTAYPLQIANSATCPVTINSGGELDLNGQSEIFYSLTLSGTGIGGAGALVNTSSGGSGVSAPVILAANTTIGGLGAITLTNVISGPGSLTYAGTGGTSSVLLLGGFNTYSGGTLVTSGVIEAAGANSLPGSVTVGSAGDLQLDNNFAMSPTATLTLPASSSGFALNLNYVGGTTQTVARLIIGGVTQPAGTYGAVGSGATFTSALITGSGLLNVGAPYWDANHTDAASSSSANGGGNGSWDNSSADWWVSGNSDTQWSPNSEAYFAGTAGTVTLNASESAIGLDFLTPGYTINNTDGTSQLTLTGNNPVVAIPSGTTTISCMITGGGTATGLTASGPGTLVLSGANSYLNGTLITNGATVSANSISDSGTSAIGTGNVTAYGGTLSYTGSSPVTTTRNFQAAGSGPNTLDLPSGSLTVTGQVQGTNWTKTSSGTLYLGGSLDDTGLGLAINAGEVVITKTSSSTVHGLGGAASSVASGAELQLAGSGGFDLYSGTTLTVASGGMLDVNGQSDIFSTLTLAGTGIGGVGALINSSSTPSVITNNGSGVVLAGNTTVGGVGNIFLGGVVNGGSSLTYSGSATLTLSAANTFSGGLNIPFGSTVSLTNSAASGGAGTISDAGTLDVGISGNNANLTNTIMGAGVMNLEETPNQNLQLGGNLSGFTGTINCPTDPGGTAKAEVLSASATFSSAATINVAAGGTLFVSGAGVVIPCTLNLMGLGNTEAYGALRVENNSVISGPVNLFGNTTMGNGQAAASAFATISGPIVQTNGVWGIAFGNEPGTIDLTGVNNFTGYMTISNGEIVVAGSGCLGAANGTNFPGTITNNSAFVYNSTAAQILSGVISGSGQLIQLGTGKLTLTAPNSYTGNTTTSNGTLLISGGGCLGVTGAATNYAGNITNLGTFSYSSSATQTLSGVISGSGTLVENGPGTLTLAGANTTTGTMTVNAGTLAVASTGSINNLSTLTLNAGSTLDVSAYAGAFSLASAVTLQGNGTGTGVGTSAATIKGGASGTISVAGPVTLGFAPTSFSGDSTHPSLYISQGLLNLGGPGITVNNQSGTPLGAGNYLLIQQASGSVSLASTNVTVIGAGVVSGATAALSVSGGNVFLVVSGGGGSVSSPTINMFSASGGTVVFSGTNGPAGHPYYVLTTTNLALPLSQWTTNGSGTFNGSGAFSVTNTPSGSPTYYKIKTQ
jgi:autotransporter-associated beta strand protein